VFRPARQAEACDLSQQAITDEERGRRTAQAAADLRECPARDIPARALLAA